MTRILSFSAAAACALAVSGGAFAQDLRIAVGNPPSHAHSYGLTRYADAISERTDLSTSVFHGELLSLKEISPGLRDGIVDMGNVVMAYAPAQYAETNLIADLSMLVTSGSETDNPSEAMTGAVMEYVLFECEGCRAEFKAQNSIFLGTAVTLPYTLLCREPVRTLRDMEGLSFRSGAENFGRWAESVGGVKVSIPSNEIYEAMAQRVVDCAMLSPTSLVEHSLAEVSTFVLRGVPGGVYSGLAVNSVNRDAWAELTVEQRQVLIDETATLAADIIFRQNETLDEALDAAAEQGIEVADADAETLAAYAEFVEGDIPVISESFTSQYGLSDVDAKIETIRGLIDKWKDLTRDVEDAETLADLYRSEILSKLDPATYGLD